MRIFKWIEKNILHSKDLRRRATVAYAGILILCICILGIDLHNVSKQITQIQEVMESED